MNDTAMTYEAWRIGYQDGEQAARAAFAELARTQEQGPDMYADVLAFHERFGCAIGDGPTHPPAEVVALRRCLIFEEMEETVRAMTLGDLAGVADGLADLIYVALGTAVTYGIDLREVWNLVHEANMAKVGGSLREDGKILKPAGWVAPDVAGELERQTAARRPTEEAIGG